jgi:hypothetical protein
VVSYRYLPFTFQESYARRRLTIRTDTTLTQDSVLVARPVSTFTVDDIFGAGLQKSGSIVRGFTFGSNRDLSLTSGLRMSLAGKLTSDIDIAASLTDENTPIQPEGTTQSLQEFDRVFVEIKSPQLGAVLGDFVLDVPGTEFGHLTRKLQGAKGTAEYRGDTWSGGALVAGAVTRGKYNSMTFQGIEGVQGPYRLLGANNERDIIVIAGTERVYVDGEVQTRGETNDYTIDYSTSEVTFTTRRLITSASRIVVDFEYTDRRFTRSLFATQVAPVVLNNTTRVVAQYSREADDPDAPIDFSYSDSARAIIAAAGNDPSKAVVSGVTRVDSLGTYLAVDTVLAGNVLTTFYRYAPGDPQAVYTVQFSFVGTGRGEYHRESAGVFVYRGPGGGDYLPVVFLPLAQSHSMVNLLVDTRPVPGLSFTGELGQSTFDGNLLSPVDDDGNRANAFSFSGAYAPRDIRIMGISLQGIDAAFKERYLEERFVPVDRANDIEFTRKWGVDTLAAGNEEIQEASLRILPTRLSSAGGTFGRFRRGDDQSSSRYDARVSIGDPGLPRVRYIYENVRSDDRRLSQQSAWIRQRGSMDYLIGPFLPGVQYEGEDRAISPMSSSAALPGSFRFDAWTVSLSVPQAGPLSLGGTFTWRNEGVFRDSAVIPESRIFTQSYVGKLREWNNLSTSLDLTLRQRTYEEPFRGEGNPDIRTILVRNQTRYTPFQRAVEADLYYEGSTEQSSRLERFFVRVTPGSGNYTYLGELNSNGIADESEFVQARFDGDYVAITLPTEEKVPVVDLKSSLRLRLIPRRFLGQPEGWMERFLQVLSTDTYVRVEEKTTEPDIVSIYMLDFSKFQQDTTTIAGSFLFSQDLNFFEGDPLFSARLRYSQRTSMNNLSSGVERGYARERSARFRWQLIPELANQLDVVERTDRLTGSSGSSQLHDVEGTTFSLDFSYRPEQVVEVGFKLDVGRSSDRYVDPDLEADMNSQTLRAGYAFEGTGQLRFEAAREEVILSQAVTQVPYELTQGRVPGKTWLWRVNLDYRMTQFLQAIAGYDGRTEGGSPPVHSARIEVRAFF